jgi:hypothetical protein
VCEEEDTGDFYGGKLYKKWNAMEGGRERGRKEKVGGQEETSQGKTDSIY